jgi:hypothetical protein
MRLLGARALKEVVPSIVDASSISSHAVTVPSDRLYEGNCKANLCTSCPFLTIRIGRREHAICYDESQTVV